MKRNTSKSSNEDTPALGCKNIKLTTLSGSTSPMAITRSGVLSPCNKPPKPDWTVILTKGEGMRDYKFFATFEGFKPPPAAAVPIAQLAEAA